MKLFFFVLKIHFKCFIDYAVHIIIEIFAVNIRIELFRRRNSWKALSSDGFLPNLPKGYGSSDVFLRSVTVKNGQFPNYPCARTENSSIEPAYHYAAVLYSGYAVSRPEIIILYIKAPLTDPYSVQFPADVWQPSCTQLCRYPLAPRLH